MYLLELDYINKISANKIDKKPEDNTINLNQISDYQIIENSKELLIIKVINKINLEPEALFSMDIEYIMEFELKEEIKEEYIKANIDNIIRPLGPEISFMIATITKEMIGSRIILPPAISINNID